MLRMRSTYDVVVVGAGTAGAIAGIAAARTGAKTLVIDQYGSLGGVLTLGMALLGAADAEGYQALGGIGGELFDRARAMRGAVHTYLDPIFGSVLPQDPEATKLVLIEMAREAGVNFLLHAFLAEVLVRDQWVDGVIVADKAGLEVIRASSFVDCTGDADLVARAQGQFTMGRLGDGQMQPVSRIFRVGGVELEAVWDYLDSHPEDMGVPEGWSGEPYDVGFLRTTPGAHFNGFFSLVKKAQEAGDYHIPRDSFAIYTFPGQREVGINTTRVHGIDGTNPDDVTRAEIETQLQMYEALQFFWKYVPGFANAYIVSTPFQVGIRETRHIQGSYVLTSEDVMEGRDFFDQVGRGAYPLDVHKVDPAAGGRRWGPNPEPAHPLGDHAPNTLEATGMLKKIPRSYGIPVRCLMPLGVDNVTVGGRSISATHEAAGSVRGQAVCMVTGHAAGTLAALAAGRHEGVRAVPIATLQAVLRAQGAILERNQKIKKV